MERKLGWGLVAAGLALTCGHLAGVYAVFSDTATTGENYVSSPVAGRAADLQLAAYTGDPEAPCGTWSDNLESGINVGELGEYYDSDNGTWNTVGVGRTMCLRNDGAAPLVVTVATTDLSFTDSACSGDESAVDNTCGPSAGADENTRGELRPLLQFGGPHDQANSTPFAGDCADAVKPAFIDTSVEALADPATPVTLFTLPAGSVACLYAVAYDGPRTLEQQQARQTDVARWRYLFTGRTA